MLRIIIKPLAHYVSTVCSASTSYLLPSNSPTRLLAPWISILSSPFSHLSKQKEGSYDVVSLFNRDPTAPPKLFVVQPRLRPNAFLQAKLNEALCLANSLEEQRDGYFHIDFFDKDIPPHVVVQNPSARGARADTYFGPGTVDTIKCHLNAAESKSEVDAIFVNAILSGIQQRNLERAWDKPVLDRVGLIIEIFNAHAYTKEAKLQAELAALMYKKSRLVRVRGLDGRYTFGATGEAEVVSARGRGSGGRGFISGAGETELQLQRRRILERRNHLYSQIEEVRRTRSLQRASRKRHGGSNGQHLATVAVVGYTNAGKSTLVSALSDNYLYSDSRLFATVDPRLRSVFLPSGRKVLLSDTVGFISDLPVQLVEAFHATLEEVVEADLLVHVVDCTAPNLDEHRLTVFQVLQQIGVSKMKLEDMIEVWNKIDYHEEGKSIDESCDDDNGKAGNSSGEDSIGGKLSSVLDDAGTNNFIELEKGDITKKQATEVISQENFGNRMEGQESDCCEDWLADDDDQNQNPWIDEGQRMGEDVQASGDQSGPHVRISATLGVGLRELLQLIDNKLKVQDEKLKAQNVLERNVFERKWRPSQIEAD
ncbi:GTP-binding protein At3g49725, chloroplastic isoform X2 [Benincasa hispida]|uniref:GTP-binding protein At3g49725, chloroplastic isoform X2 n=1 Tax=Benincasa hispida TaxID=102211 RepID=UPI0018FF3710|nr:GTP-binding protein At3g49725, chloroplastic isoform X2 [Benincasa hispida]